MTDTENGVGAANGPDWIALTDGQPETKRQYLRRLERALRGCPRRERKNALTYYAEIIDDLTEGVCAGQCEDGGKPEAEAEAIASLESPENAAESIVANLPVVPRSVTWARRFGDPVFWFLAVVGSPMWLLVLFVALLVAACGYGLIWLGILVVWIVVAACALAGVWAVAACAWGLFHSLVPFALMVLGIGCAFAAVCALLLVPAVAITVWLARFSYHWLMNVIGKFFTVRKQSTRAAAVDSHHISYLRFGHSRRWFKVVAKVFGVLALVAVLSFCIGYVLSGFNVSMLNQKMPIGELHIGG